ncbi:restriction endonuclease subunit S [Kouleothrix sp.]|uniref:restriction endonuclease subunit S n=1 Tax=Kouleothrix sp. TaxID=2779161 RepID=UPI003919B377
MTTLDMFATQDLPRALPKGWRWIKIREIGPVTDGDWILNTDYSPSGVRLLQVGDVGSGKFVGKSSRYITEERARELNCTFLQPRDILISRMPDPIGRACILPDLGYPCITAVDVSVWRPRANIANPEFLSFFLNSPDWFITVAALASGATRARISRSNLENIEIPLPPLPEQRRIAAILAEQLAAVERARAAAAERLAAAQALPAAYLRAVFESEAARRWPKTKLGNLLQLRKDVVHPYDNPQGIATFVGLEHVESQTGRRIGGIEIEMAELTGRKPRFYKGDIVYGYLRPYLNKLWLAEFDGLCSVDQYVYSVKPEIANTEFVAWFMRSPVYLDRAPINTTPGQLPRIRTEEVVTVEINLPSLMEQQRIAATVTGWMAAAAEARTAIAAQLAAIEALPAALLRRAFSGQL